MQNADLLPSACVIFCTLVAAPPLYDRRGFIGSLARCLALTVTVLAVRPQFGIQTTSLLAVLAGAEHEARSTVE